MKYEFPIKPWVYTGDVNKFLVDKYQMSSISKKQIVALDRFLRIVPVLLSLMDITVSLWNRIFTEAIKYSGMIRYVSAGCISQLTDIDILFNMIISMANTPNPREIFFTSFEVKDTKLIVTSYEIDS